MRMAWVNLVVLGLSAISTDVSSKALLCSNPCFADDFICDVAPLGSTATDLKVFLPL